MTVLAGIRVIDLSEYIAGPFGGMLLGDLGADVIKVEPPGGDRWRQGLFYAPYESRNNLAMNRSKRSIALDLATEEGRSIAYDLVKTADVVMHNYRRGVAERLGVGYDTLSHLKPDLIYLHNTAFGAEGPLADKGGYDLLSQAASGFLTGPDARVVEGRLAGGGAGIAIADIASGMFQALAVCAALWHRERTGEGQKIDTSLLGAGLSIQTGRFMSIEKADLETRERFLQELHSLQAAQVSFEQMLAVRAGFRQAMGAAGLGIYYRVFETKDAPIAVANLNDRLRKRMADAIGVKDPRFEDPNYDPRDPAYQERSHRLVEETEAIFRTKTREEWYRILDAAGVPCGPVNFIEEMFDDPQVLANGYTLELEHPTVGALRMAGPPFAFHSTPLRIERASPALSQHAGEILAELGYPKEQVEELYARSIVRRPVTEEE